MEKSAKIQNPNMGLRWVAFLTILLNVGLSYFIDFLPGASATGEISDKYNTLFTPAPFTFSIWAVIYAAFIVYGIAQLVPSESGKWIYDYLARPVIFIHLMSMIWLVAFSYELMTTSIGVMVLMLTGGIVAFGRAKHSMINPAYSRLLTVPFSLFLGWISVALIANVAVYLVYLGVNPGARETVNLTGLMITVAFLLALTISLVFRDWIVPLVISWAMYGIYEANRDFNQAIGELALIGAVILALWGICYGIYRSARLRQFLNYYRHLHSHEPSHHS